MDSPFPSTTIPPSNNVEDFISEEDFFKDFEKERRYSADTVLDDKGIPHIAKGLNSLTGGDETEQMSDDEALENTAVLMDVRETAQGYGLSLWVDGTFKNADHYFYAPQEKQRLIKAWSRVIGHYKIKVSPWIDVLFTEAVCTGPMITLAYQARKYRLENERLKTELKNQFADTLSKSANGRTVYQRSDTKTQWKVDENGNFEYTESNTYIPKKNRKMKPDLTPENYELLCKHNGKAYIDAIFKIENEA